LHASVTFALLEHPDSSPSTLCCLGAVSSIAVIWYQAWPHVGAAQELLNGDEILNPRPMHPSLPSYIPPLLGRPRLVLQADGCG
jgi:hypothetical protein